MHLSKVLEWNPILAFQQAIPVVMASYTLRGVPLSPVNVNCRGYVEKLCTAGAKALSLCVVNVKKSIFFLLCHNKVRSGTGAIFFILTIKKTMAGDTWQLFSSLKSIRDGILQWAPFCFMTSENIFLMSSPWSLM